MDDTERTNEVIATVREMNRLWIETWDEAAFGRYIHPDAVAIAPTTPGRLEGRDAYVAGWRGFVEAAKIHEWNETGHRVRFFCPGHLRRAHVLLYHAVYSWRTGGCHAGPGHVHARKAGRPLAGGRRPVFTGTRHGVMPEELRGAGLSDAFVVAFIPACPPV